MSSSSHPHPLSAVLGPSTASNGSHRPPTSLDPLERGMENGIDQKRDLQTLRDGREVNTYGDARPMDIDPTPSLGVKIPLLNGSTPLQTNGTDGDHTNDSTPLPVRSSSSDPEHASGEPSKKRKKRGWKGWALVVEDAEGNVLEVRERGESPPMGHTGQVVDIPERSTFFKRGEGSAGLPILDDLRARDGSATPDGPRSRKAKSASPFVGTRNLPPVSSTMARTASNPRAPKPTISDRRKTSNPASKSTRSSRPDLLLPTHNIDTPDKPYRPTPGERARTPRVGLGEFFDAPPQSDAREEAMYIISRNPKRGRSDQLHTMGSPTSSGSLTPPPPIYPQPGEPGAPGSTGAPVNLISAMKAPSPSFEDRWNAVMNDYQARAAMTKRREELLAAAPGQSLQEISLGRGAEDMKPPKFHSGQRPTVVLAPAAGKRPPRDRLEKEYMDGYEGLPGKIETDCEGFVGNVQENLRNIAAYHYPQPSGLRDAFLERVGRGLIELGRQLTQSGDGALQ